MIQANLPAGQSILFIIAVSYLVSALLLGIHWFRGGAVSKWVIVTWLVTGVVGAVLSRALQAGRPAVWIGVLIALGPWMCYSLYYDLRERIWVMALVDVAGLVAIVMGLMMAREALR